MSHPFEAAGTFRGIISERESELETLKAQLATARHEANCGGVSVGKTCSDPSEPGHEIFGCFHGQEDGSFLCEFHWFKKQLRESEAQVRELRNLVSGIRLLCLCALDIAVVDDIRKLIDEAALRSAPPSGPRQAIPLCPKCGFSMTDMTDRLVCSDCGHVIRPPAYQAFFAKTNAGEERKDLARQGSDASGDAIEGEQSACSSPKQPQSIPKQSWDGVSSPEPFSEASEQVPAASHCGDAHAIGAEGKGTPATERPGKTAESSNGPIQSQQTDAGGNTAPPLSNEQSGPQDSPSRSECKWEKAIRRIYIGYANLMAEMCDVNMFALRVSQVCEDVMEPAPPSPAREKEKAE